MHSPIDSPVRHLMEAGRLERFFIDGDWVLPDGGDRFAVVSPSTEDTLCEIPLGNARDADRAVQAARNAFERWAATSPQQRATLLDRVHALMLERAERFALALAMEMGAPINYARGAHVPLAAEHIRVARDNLASYPFLTRRGTTAIVREPIGVCALITPWNWPIYQITAKVGPALAAGCTVVLKPSELSPLSALLFAEVIADAGVPAGVFNLVSGSGTEVGAALASHPEVDMVSITGSTRAGVLVAQAAAPTVKRVAQELGGKSPNIVLPDADLSRAIAPGVAAAFRNMGQSCSAPTRMIVPRSVLGRVEALAVAATQQLVVGDPFADTTTHGPLANRAQFGRVAQMIDAGLDERAKLIAGGPGRPAGFDRGFYARPTVFSEVRTDMTIAQQEIFGPVLAILPYDTVDEAVAIANDTVYGLGAHVQGTDKERVRAVAARLRSGQVHLNYPAWDPQAPFGGYKQSGNGREYGIEGMEEYMEVKSIVGFGD
ncbi:MULTISPECIES: aldehyde dehydrogenase family protein [unclassified Burkholderia]|uniref:aldehyde dehydrogenase family protein n=1 Tax=unclassified Burkholderia TaxID=2613784 RepID=UPI000F58631F|nr:MULTISPECIES: aldehyde dehydrogenase family protein [unclassified Burkholderia]RQR81596.1 aldehyde dehydrogenase family protein [Burkholderia sp. Bp9011]RQR91297.1 aldehyde dehydrogenase family protein [Burkholderia sp. Bp9010]RQS75712.1 aldehyde dehydrogenase family protein [Burkholderia sp. Bp8977]